MNVLFPVYLKSLLSLAPCEVIILYYHTILYRLLSYLVLCDLFCILVLCPCFQSCSCSLFPVPGSYGSSLFLIVSPFSFEFVAPPPSIISSSVLCGLRVYYYLSDFLVLTSVPYLADYSLAFCLGTLIYMITCFMNTLLVDSPSALP